MGYAVISLGLFQRQYLRRYESNTATVQLGFWPTFGNALGNVRVWKALAITAANSMANWTIQGLGNYIFIRYRHYDPIFTAFVFGGGGAIGGLFVPLGTVWADRLGRRPVVAALGLFTAVVLGLLFYAAPPNWTMVVLSACGSFGISSVYSLGYTITQDAIASVFRRDRHRHRDGGRCWVPVRGVGGPDRWCFRLSRRSTVGDEHRVRRDRTARLHLCALVPQGRTATGSAGRRRGAAHVGDSDASSSGVVAGRTGLGIGVSISRQGLRRHPVQRRALPRGAPGVLVRVRRRGGG